MEDVKTRDSFFPQVTWALGMTQGEVRAQSITLFLLPVSNLPQPDLAQCGEPRRSQGPKGGARFSAEAAPGDKPGPLVPGEIFPTPGFFISAP